MVKEQDANGNYDMSKPRVVLDGHNLNSILEMDDKQLVSFLGLMSYFRSMILLYSRLTQDVDSLRQYKDLLNVWTARYTTIIVI